MASGDQRIVTVAGLQALAVALDDQAVAVVLDIANPFQAVRDFGLGGSACRVLGEPATAEQPQRGVLGLHCGGSVVAWAREGPDPLDRQSPERRRHAISSCA